MEVSLRIDRSRKTEITAALIRRVRQNVTLYFVQTDSPAEQADAFERLFLSPASDRHPSDDPFQTDLGEDRYDRAYVVAAALRSELAARKGIDERTIRILIDPFVDPLEVRSEEVVYTAYLYTPDPLDLDQAVLLYATAVPAGQRFATEDALAMYLAEQYAQLERGYRRAVASVMATAD